METSTPETPTSTFAQRLRELIGEQSVAAFARKVGLGEALIRKYLNGAEPSLSRANQIARAANCSLEWLATGGGFRYRQAEVVDMAALELAIKYALQLSGQQDAPFKLDATMKLMVTLYQYLRATKKPDGSFDEEETLQFGRYIAGICGV